MSDALTGSAVTVTYSDGGTSVVVMAGSPSAVMAGLNTGLGLFGPERHAFVRLDAVDAAKSIYVNFDYVAEITVEPHALVDMSGGDHG